MSQRRGKGQGAGGLGPEERSQRGLGPWIPQGAPMIGAGFRCRERERQEAVLALGGVSMGEGCSSNPTRLPPRASSSASTLTLPGTSWAPTSRPVSFRAWGPGGLGAAGGRGGREALGISPLPGNRRLHAQEALAPRCAETVPQFPPQWKRKDHRTSGKGRDSISPWREEGRGSRCFRRRRAQPRGGAGGAGSPGPSPGSVIHSEDSRASAHSHPHAVSSRRKDTHS